MNGVLHGQVALVTGGGSGIGLACATHLARDGAAVVLAGRTEAKLAAAAEGLRAAGADVATVVCDVTDEASVQAACAVAASRGRFTMVVANAGAGAASPLHLTTLDEWQQVLGTNLTGTFLTIKHAARQMASQQPSGGAIVGMSSGAGHFPHRYLPAYGASKAGLISMMKAIAVEHARDGIRCNAVLPGWIESEMTAGALSWDKFVEKVLPRVPLRRWGKKEDFSGVAVYLASDASGYHTGDVLTIDGGYHSF